MPPETPVVAVIRSVVLVVLVVWMVVELVVGLAVGLPSSDPQPRCQDGHSTGVRNTMMHTTAAKQAPDAISSLPLRSSAPNNVERKNPLRRKKRAMLTELFTR